MWFQNVHYKVILDRQGAYTMCLCGCDKIFHMSIIASHICCLPIPPIETDESGRPLPRQLMAERSQQNTSGRLCIWATTVNREDCRILGCPVFVKIRQQCSCPIWGPGVLVSQEMYSGWLESYFYLFTDTSRPTPTWCEWSERKVEVICESRYEIVHDLDCSNRRHCIYYIS